MLRKLLATAAILLIASCGGKMKNAAPETKKPEPVKEAKIEDKSNEQNNYQSVEDEKQAVQMDKQTQEEIEEIEVRDRVFFGFDDITLSKEAKEILDIQTEWLQSDQSINITIEGHCDERGTREYNLALGERRALAAKNYLIKKGISSSRIRTISYGKERPAFLEASDSAWAKNRRSVVVIN